MNENIHNTEDATGIGVPKTTMPNTYIVGRYEYCKRCNCPTFDHNEDPVDDCPKKRVYDWQGTHVIASSIEHARCLLNDEFGERCGSNRYQPKRIKGPFGLWDFDSDEGRAVNEDEYIRKVATYAGGIVKEM